MTDEYHNPFISDAVQAVHKAVESANKNLDNALEVATGALKEISLKYQNELDKPIAPDKWFVTARDMCDYADDALTQIAAILKVKQKD